MTGRPHIATGLQRVSAHGSVGVMVALYGGMHDTTNQTNGAVMGGRVEYVVDGKVIFAGVLLYSRPDGWVGIRSKGGRIDEVLAQFVRAEVK